jgi:5-(carboxyamino)imidazole ribonucleotide synthase
VAPFYAIDTPDDFAPAIAECGLPAILKTRRFGYDGKGQRKVDDRAGLAVAFAELGGRDLILEGLIGFALEMSVIVVRGRGGDVRVYAPGENTHVNHILKETRVPAGVGAATLKSAETIARAIAEALDYVGVLGVELFVVREGGSERLLVNEIAPRVHNSGHWTIEGAACSQFENHVRAVLGLPLGDTSSLGVNVMFNWIGDLPESAPVLAEPRAHWHDYGKEPRAGRKVGHATLCAFTAEEMRERLARVAWALGRENQAEPALQALQADQTVLRPVAQP